jgi:hypothetical protein
MDVLSKVLKGFLGDKNTKDLKVSDFASGSMGRLTMYTENAIKDLEVLK